MYLTIIPFQFKSTLVHPLGMPLMLFKIQLVVLEQDYQFFSFKNKTDPNVIKVFVVAELSVRIVSVIESHTN